MLQRFLKLFYLTLLLPHLAIASYSDKPEVKNFINKMAHKHHFNKTKLITLFNQVKSKPIVIHHVKEPLEKKPWYTYQMLFVTQWRIRQGVEFWNKYQKTLERAEKTYGVPASIIVATIGIETKYGKNTGKYRVLDALSNLGFSDSPRAAFFRQELEQFLLLTREQHVDPLKMMGSYAGAIGQPQFMPSSYRHYAVNFSGDSKIDLSHDEIDIIGSIANYYNKHGWKTNQPIVTKTQHQPFGFLTHTHNATSDIDRDQKSHHLELQGYLGKEHWRSYANFDVIKRYNPSDLYAMAVYQLSYYISILKGKTDNA